MKKYRLLTVQFTYNNCIFTKMIAIPCSESNPITKGAVINCISLKEEIEEEGISDLLILNSIELTKDEYLTF